MQHVWDDDFFDLPGGDLLCETVYDGEYQRRVLENASCYHTETNDPRPVQPSDGYVARGYIDRKLDLYHITTREDAQSILANGFHKSADGMLGCGIYLSTELDKAKRYTTGHLASDKVIIQVKAKVGKVIAINYHGHPRQKNWHDPRYSTVYDTAWVPPKCEMVKSGLEECCIWDLDRIQIIKIIDPYPVQPPDKCSAWRSAFLCIILFLWIF
ncbi:uncharacterized protein LOC121939506, partial [Plectropomus leopardus]|uniref:uncharacterized protein LOC121939506 n=1 Tax=Plectropomus leopardus TaxID=160734 RepID=UPI001C4B7B65